MDKNGGFLFLTGKDSKRVITNGGKEDFV